MQICEIWIIFYLLWLEKHKTIPKQIILYCYVYLKIIFCLFKLKKFNVYVSNFFISFI